MDRCNLTILEAARPGGHRRIPRRASRSRSSPRCRAIWRTTSNAQRGKGVFDSLDPCAAASSTRWATAATARASMLNLVYNPQGPSLPPPQAALEADYKRILGENHGVVFNRALHVRQHADPAFRLDADLQGRVRRLSRRCCSDAHQDANLDGVMCRNLISVDWRGYVYDCDFNQMLDLPMTRGAHSRVHLSELLDDNHRRQSDPRCRPLLRLHRRPGFELRRRAQGGGGIASLACPAFPSSSRR